MPLLDDPNLWLYVLAGIFALSLLIPLVTVVHSRKLAGGAESESGDGPPVAEIFRDPSIAQPHLVEMRKRLTWSLLVLIAAIAISFVFSRQMLDLLTQPIGGLDQLQAIEVTEPLSVFMRVAFVSGFVLALPFVFAQVWLFIASALRENEFRHIYYALPAAVALFLAGAAFAYWVMLPVAIPFLVGFQDIPTVPRPANYIKFVTSLVFWVGMSFELPLVMFVLARLGLVTAKGLARRWRYAVVIIAVMAAMITPTVDLVNMGLVLLPLLVLYLLSILMAWVAYRPRDSSSA